MEVIYQEIPRVYTAVSEWAACMVYVAMFRRHSLKQLALLGAGALAVQVFYLSATAGAPVALWVPVMLGAILLMYVILLWFSRMRLWAAGYCCVRAFLLAEFTASLEWQLHTWLFQARADVWVIQQLFFLAIYATVFGAAYGLEKRTMKQEFTSQIGVNELLVVSGIVLIAFALSNLSFVRSGLPFTSNLPQEIGNIRTLVDLGGLATLYALQSMFGEQMADQELAAINSVLRTQYDQYCNYQHSMEMMNIKYHDLKHQIAGLRGEQDQEKRTAWLDYMEQEIDSVHETYQTGSRVLDTILEAKSYQCRKHNIKLTCVADGRLLEHLHVVDICTIFGNALDNAIESVILVQQEDKRLIHLSLSAVKQFIYIKIENYCEQDVPVEKGQFPKTSKADKKNHGYGLKSIRYTVEKNGGSCDFSVRENWFELKILLPLNT